MGDGLKLIKDKRHRSSSSLVGAALEGTRSERKLDQNPSIPEIDDQFSIAEGRCDQLQDTLDLIKTLKKKKKLKKRSMTRIAESPKPLISVRTQPKLTKLQQAARVHRLEGPNPTRSYVDPATVEQHRMIGQVRGYNQSIKYPHQEHPRTGHIQGSTDERLKHKREGSHADGDNRVAYGWRGGPQGEMPPHRRRQPQTTIQPSISNQRLEERPVEELFNKSRMVPARTAQRQGVAPTISAHLNPVPQEKKAKKANQRLEERPVEELFNKSRMVPARTAQRQGVAPTISAPMNPVPQEKKAKKVRDHVESMPMEQKNEGTHHPRRVKYRSRGYEMPTVASQMKQAGMRNYYDNSNHTNIPFIVSKSTTPSHNIGVNIQQVLNGFKIQQPLSKIPLSIAHHMGLGHLPMHCAEMSSNQQPSLDHYKEMNTIRVGQRVVKLPSFRTISFKRLLNMYREGEGMVPRFLRAINRPHIYYTSMYNLAMNREDFDCATSKGRGGSQVAKQSLVEYSSLYREFEHIDKCIREGADDPELERRKEELTRELAAREEHIRKVVQEYRTGGEQEQQLRASASTAEDGYRYTFKLGEA